MKNILIGLFIKIHELEQALEAEQRYHQETLKEVKRNDKRVKDLLSQSEEDRRNQARLQDLVDNLQNKLRSYKRQTEEAEEIAAANLSKFRKLQADLEEARGRADVSENQLLKVRIANRVTSSQERASPMVSFFLS